MESKFHTILVRGGRTGKKLHKASSGSSVLACGHWTRAHVRNFEVADDVSEETIAKFKAAGHEFCEKCFPEFAKDKAEKAAEYTGPKMHIKRVRDIRPNPETGGYLVKYFQGVGCGSRSAWNDLQISAFGKKYRENPEQCCKKCVQYYLDAKKRFSV